MAEENAAAKKNKALVLGLEEWQNYDLWLSDIEESIQTLIDSNGGKHSMAIASLIHELVEVTEKRTKALEVLKPLGVKDAAHAQSLAAKLD